MEGCFLCSIGTLGLPGFPRTWTRGVCFSSQSLHLHRGSTQSKTSRREWLIPSSDPSLYESPCTFVNVHAALRSMLVQAQGFGSRTTTFALRCVASTLLSRVGNHNHRSGRSRGSVGLNRGVGVSFVHRVVVEVRPLARKALHPIPIVLAWFVNEAVALHGRESFAAQARAKQSLDRHGPSVSGVAKEERIASRR